MEILYTSPWVPAEWIAAHGFTPRGAWATDYEPSAALSEGVCAFAQSMTGLIGRQSEAAMVMTTACDQMRRAGDKVTAHWPKRIFLFNLPATWQTPVARKLYYSEIVRLGGFLEAFGGAAPTETQLVAVMRQFEERRHCLRQWIHRSPGLPSVQAVTDFYWNNAVPAPPCAVSVPRGVPLAIVGGPLPPSQWYVLKEIEDLGGCIALNATESGERCILPPLSDPGTQEAPLQALANHYFDHAVDVFHRPNSQLYAWLSSRLEERRIRGLILRAQVGCDLWRAEAESLREAFQRPVLMLDTQNFPSGRLRDAQRLAAFMESLA